jgi:hypothetical protein
MARRTNCPPTAEEWVELYAAMRPEEQQRAWLLLRQREGLLPRETIRLLLQRIEEFKYQEMEGRGLFRQYAARFKPVPKRKAGRDPAIHRLRTVDGIRDWRTIRDRLNEENSAWVTKRTGGQVGVKALKNGYQAWLKGRPEGTPESPPTGRNAFLPLPEMHFCRYLSRNAFRARFFPTQVLICSTAR